jgi:uncharacterized protein (DUF885 family)
MSGRNSGLRRGLKIASLALVGGLATFTVPTAWGKPWSVNHFYMRTLLEQVWRSPELCTSLHLLDWRADKLDERTVRARVEENALVAHELETLHRYDRAAMSPAEQVSYDVMDFFLATMGGQDSGLGGTGASPYAIEQLGGIHVAFPDFLINQHDVGSRSDAEHYVARLRAVGPQFDQVIATSKDDAGRGIVPPKFVLESVERDARAFTVAAAADNPLVTSLRTKLATVKDLDDSARADLVAQAVKAVDEVVKPAYVRYVAAVVELAAQAADDAGLWHTTGGVERYGRYLRAGTASELSADEVHAMGLAEVERLEGEIRTTLAKAGLPTESPEAEVRKLHDDPRFLLPRTEEGRKEILAKYQAILDDIGSKLGTVSNIPLTVKMKVEPVPAFKEVSAPGAYYDPPPLDDSRPGIFYVNLSIPQFSYGMRTLAYHEGIPGHHYQLMTARHEKALPMFRQIVPFNSYVEGWALWAEQVAADLGFEEDPYDRLGFLSEQLLRASRLVVDTGIHVKRWTRAQALAYFLAHTTSDEKEVAIEIDRYVVWPGQACGYMVGKKTIERLAAKAKAELGPKYDLRAFNDVVLRAGALPMPVLERVVGDWIAAQK